MWCLRYVALRYAATSLICMKIWVFKNAVFPSWCRYNNFSMPSTLFSFIMYILRKIPMLCEGQGLWLNNNDFSEKCFMQRRHLKSCVFNYLIWSSVKPWLRRESTNWSWPWPLAETNGKIYIIERAIESAGKRQNMWLHLHLSYIHLGSSVCHPVCHPVCRPVCRPVVVAERWVILYVLAIKLTKKTRRRVCRGRD